MADSQATVATVPFRILVTGWRDWPEQYAHIISQHLDSTARQSGNGFAATRPIIVVEGECPYGGVDLYAKQWAEREPLASVEAHPAERGLRGQILGPARNSRMVAAGADLCLAFPGPNSRGTWDCVQKAVDADIPVRVVAWCTDWAREWAEDADLPVR